MSKTKVSSKADKPSKVNKVKEAAVAKTEKKAAKVSTKESKNKKKAPTPSSSSESESESEESSSSSSESEEEKPVKKVAKKEVAKKVAKKAESSSESSSEDEEMKDASSSSSESEDEKPAPKKAVAKKVAEKEESSSESSSDSESEDEKSAKKEVAKEESSDSSDSESESEDEAPKAKKESSDSDSSDSSDSESDSEASEETPKDSKKRKADDEPAASAKKSKTDDLPEGASANLFVGNLSWNVDEEWLQREFEEFGELSGCRIVTDRESGRSRGFGYVEFTNVADAAKAFEAKKGTELDNRPINIDYAAARQNNAGGDRTQARAKTYGDQTSPESDTLFVGNLPFGATEDAMHEVFGEQGTVLGIRLPTNPDDGRLKGFGYVQFSSVEEAKAAHGQLQGFDFDGRPLRLDFSTPRPPRENGGGFGGGRGGGGRGRGGFGRGGGDRGGRGRGGFGGRGGRGGFGDRGGRGGYNKASGGIPEFKGTKVTF
ncbi:hypothetical protein N7495_009642 [Penicillium taxi]|uniref:uncharacterized protein n=1 Tax=Penicillium taxi TaxID=168475 RepID=UPI0025455569|nr:uncharacterized protein N7495_009642 [Penicillium taxi]KAJ5885132.1 hypothetical protein N7495_009642 [Penicillium taxi]